jgi:hypothetical protein
MLCHIVEENYLNERDLFQESVMAHSFKDLALICVDRHCHLECWYNRLICITEMGN